MSDSDEPFEPDSPRYDSEGIVPYDEPGKYDTSITSESTLDSKMVSIHRKAFVRWVNEVLYPQVIRSDDKSSLQVYQKLVKTYLGLHTPYRGVLVYHGLGTGKTATAVTLAEGLSSELKIHTLLPASLETEFIKEVRRWGIQELHLYQGWSHRLLKDMSKEELAKATHLYGLSTSHINTIVRITKASYKKKLIQDSEDSDTKLEADIRKADKQIQAMKGIWLPEGSPLEDESTICKQYPDPLSNKQTHAQELDSIEKEYILQQVNYLISKKYNFIHYRPFPKVDTADLPEFKEVDEVVEEMFAEDLDETDTKEARTHNQTMVKNFEKALRYNQKHHDIDSPFYKEVIIIDEVHNFVRQIVNDSKPSKIFYNWIVNAKDVKVVFLSGTPVINKPCEIAILYNMLYGLVRIFTFTVKTTLTPEELTENLEQTIYDTNSPIELFHVVSQGGKCIVSFIQEHTGFESLRDPENKDDAVVYTIQSNDTTFEDFIQNIYHGFETSLKQGDVVCPSKAEYEKLSKKDKRDIYRGSDKIFDTELDIPFQKQQTLFDIHDGERMIDLTDNDEFMDYFFENQTTIPKAKKTLLKRMLMGLTSYYPIDRSSIVDMPQVVKPTIEDSHYRDYTIVNDMNIVTCMMSQVQFEKYNEVWEREHSMDKHRRLQGKSLFDDDSPYHYKTRTRQSCNIIFRQDDFRTLTQTESNKQQIQDDKNRVYQELSDSGALRIDRDLKHVSPKMFRILDIMKPYVKNKQSKGKIMFYSDFRSDAGSEAFELVLQSNGYEKFDSKKPQETPGLRYTFITGAEDTEERRVNKEYYNMESNKHGEYIQIMIISSAGAEGLSLSCVRQVHILEPYWNYVRINQVLGRAIRMRSHAFLDKKDRNVEQYMYVSTLPESTQLESIYSQLVKDDTWSLPEWSDIRAALSKAENKSYKDLLESVVNINTNSDQLTTDQYLFQVMESKHKISTEITQVIKESSLDCIAHTKDTPELNDRCIRFSDSLQGEIAYFPGVPSHLLETIDVKQLRATTLVHLKPNIYVVSGSDKSNNQRFIYYEYDLQQDETRDEIDIRYLRDNATRVLDLFTEERMACYFMNKEHPQDALFGKEFSVYQEIYMIQEDTLQEAFDRESFPSLSKLIQEDLLQGYKLKYNINQTYYYIHAPIDPDRIIKMYPYTEFQQDNYTTNALRPIILHNDSLYIAS